MVAMSYFCRQNVSQISLEIVANCSHPSEILALVLNSGCEPCCELEVSCVVKDGNGDGVMEKD